MLVQQRNRSSSRLAPSERPAGHGSGGRASAQLDPNAVWNGKILDWPLENNSVQMRYGSILVEGLQPGEYKLNVDGYGPIKPGDKFPLPSGDRVLLTLAVYSRREENCTFKVFLYKHDTSSPQDGGSLIGGAPEQYHWFPPPTERDISVTLSPEMVRLRPWHRYGFGSPKARITVSNWSYMELGVKPQVYRGDTPDKGVQVSKLPEYALPPEKSVSLPVIIRLNPRERNENFTLCANAMALPPKEAAQPFVAPCDQQTFVDYVPFKQLWWYDYPLLFGGAWLLVCALVWIFWGIPEKAGAIVDLHVKKPAGVFLKSDQIQVSLQSRGENPVTYRFDKDRGSDTYRFLLPKRWLGLRWPLGWNGSSQEPQHYDVLFQLSGEAKDRYEVVPQEPVAIAYADERRKFHDPNYVIKCDAPLGVQKTPDKPKESVPAQTVPTLPNPAPNPPIVHGPGGGQDGQSGHTDPPHRKPAPGVQAGADTPLTPPVKRDPIVSRPIQKLTAEEKAIKDLCGRAGLPLRTDNPLGLALGVHAKDASRPSELAFELPAQPCYFQLYSFRGGTWHALLSFKKNDMLDQTEAIVREANPTEGEYEMAWKNSDVPASLPPDDAGNNTDIEYMLLTVAGDVPVSDEARKDLRGFVKTLGLASPKWSAVSWKGHRKAAGMPFEAQ